MGEFSALSDYLKQIKDYKALSKENADELILELESESDEDMKNEIYEELINSVLKLVVSRVMLLCKQSMLDISDDDKLDMIQAGNEVLMKAIEKYDISTNMSFSSYATFWIDDAIKKARRNSAYPIRLPVVQWTLIGKLIEAEKSLPSILGHTPSDTEFAEYLNISLKTLNDLKLYRTRQNVYSFDFISDSDDEPYLEPSIEYNPIEKVNLSELQQYVLSMVSELDLTEQEIICMKFGINTPFNREMQIHDIANKLNISQSDCTKLLNSALLKLKKLMKGEKDKWL